MCLCENGEDLPARPVRQGILPAASPAVLAVPTRPAGLLSSQEHHHTQLGFAVPAQPAVNRSSAVLPGGRNSGQKAQKGPQKKKFLAEFWLILPKTGRKGAAENFQKSSLFLAVITTYNVHQDKIKFDF